MKLLPNSIVVNKVTIEYLNKDGDSDNTEPQILTITAEPVLLGLRNQGENSHYIILQTERFALEDTQELRDILKDFESRIKEY